MIKNQKCPHNLILTMSVKYINYSKSIHYNIQVVCNNASKVNIPLRTTMPIQSVCVISTQTNEPSERDNVFFA